MADLHIGDSMSDFKLIMERIEHIKNTPNAYCILDGDLMDTAVCTSIGDTYGANLQPMEQLRQCVKIFEPIKDKILAVLPGNHENRVYKSDGLDITEIMCSQLGIPEKYSQTTALLFVRFGKKATDGATADSYTPSMRHTDQAVGEKRVARSIGWLIWLPLWMQIFISTPTPICR